MLRVFKQLKMLLGHLPEIKYLHWSTKIEGEKKITKTNNDKSTEKTQIKIN